MPILTAKQWRELRDQAGKLQYLIAEIQEKDPAKLHKAEEIYEKWIKAKITYRDAEKRLRGLIRKIEAKA